MVSVLLNQAYDRMRRVKNVVLDLNPPQL
jgi:hypothetical protein